MANKKLTRIFFRNDAGSGYYYKQEKIGRIFAKKRVVEKRVEPIPKGRLIPTIVDTDLDDILKEIALSEAKKQGLLHSVNAYEAVQDLYNINTGGRDAYHPISLWVSAIQLYRI